jgi:hypothetical protein
MYWPWYWEVCEGSERPNGPEGWGGQDSPLSISKIFTLQLILVGVLENRRTEEYNERSLKHLSLIVFLWDFF